MPSKAPKAPIKKVWHGDREVTLRSHTKVSGDIRYVVGGQSATVPLRALKNAEGNSLAEMADYEIGDYVNANHASVTKRSPSKRPYGHVRA